MGYCHLVVTSIVATLLACFILVCFLLLCLALCRCIRSFFLPFALEEAYVFWSLEYPLDVFYSVFLSCVVRGKRGDFTNMDQKPFLVVVE
jgi:hypothetical protein